MPSSRLTILATALALLSPLGLAACVGLGVVEQVADRSVPLAPDARFALPARPDYPDTDLLVQTVIGQYDDRRTAFQAVLELSPSRAHIVLTAASGPRIMSIDWTDAGLAIDRAALAPDELSGLDVLGDIFLSLWPHEAVAAALPAGYQVTDTEQGRTISNGEVVVVQITTEASEGGVRRSTFENLAFGYKLTIVTEQGDAP